MSSEYKWTHEIDSVPVGNIYFLGIQNYSTMAVRTAAVGNPIAAYQDVWGAGSSRLNAVTATQRRGDHPCKYLFSEKNLEAEGEKMKSAPLRGTAAVRDPTSWTMNWFLDLAWGNLS